MTNGKVNRIFDNNIMPGSNQNVVYSLYDITGKCVFGGKTKYLQRVIFGYLSEGKEIDSFSFV